MTLAFSLRLLRAFWPALVALVVWLCVLSYGANRFDAGAQSVVDAQAIARTGKLEKQIVTNDRIVTQFVDRERVIYKTGETIIREVPIYVPDDSCSLPGGFRVLYDAAARGELPDPAEVAHARPVAAQAVAAGTVDNFTTCHANAAQLAALQSWIREHGEPAKP